MTGHWPALGGISTVGWGDVRNPNIVPAFAIRWGRLT